MCPREHLCTIYPSMFVHFLQVSAMANSAGDELSVRLIVTNMSAQNNMGLYSNSLTLRCAHQTDIKDVISLCPVNILAILSFDPEHRSICTWRLTKEQCSGSSIGGLCKEVLPIANAGMIFLKYLIKMFLFLKYSFTFCKA